MSAAIFTKENIINNVMSALPQDLSRDEWLQALPRALVAAFVKTDIEFQQKGTYKLQSSLCIPTRVVNVHSC